MKYTHNSNASSNRNPKQKPSLKRQSSYGDGAKSIKVRKAFGSASLLLEASSSDAFVLPLLLGQELQVASLLYVLRENESHVMC